MTTLKTTLKQLRHNLRYSIIIWRSRKLVQQLSDILSEHDELPVIIVSYNNGIYTENMCQQLNSKNIKPIIIDNNSNEPKTISILKSLQHSGSAQVTYSNFNFGHGVGFIAPIYSLLPDVFVYTDPDLELNRNLPKNFLDTLYALTIKYSVFKVGFALDINNQYKLKDTAVHCRHTRPIFYEKKLSISEYEKRYWTKQLQHEKLEVYAAPIDTTFALYNKENYAGDFHCAVRVAGDFSTIHLPWFEDIDIMDDSDRVAYTQKNKSTTWSK